MRTTHHAVVALIFGLAVVDVQAVAVAHAPDVVLFAVLQSLGSFVPSKRDLRVVDPDLALKCGTLVLSSGLVTDVLQDRDGLKVKEVVRRTFGICKWHADLSELGLIQMLVCARGLWVPRPQHDPPVAG